MTWLTPAMTDTPQLHPLLAARLSACAFDAHHQLDDAVIDLLLDAARRSPSAGNSQPWAFIVGRRGDAVHTRLTARLAASTRAWVPAAGLVVANLAQIRVEDTDFEYSEFARYDLGQAVAHLTVQASALGLSVHQFRAFDRDAVARDFDVPAHWEITSMAAIGVPTGADPRVPSSGTGSSTAVRRSVADITWAREVSVNSAPPPGASAPILRR